VFRKLSQGEARVPTTMEALWLDINTSSLLGSKFVTNKNAASFQRSEMQMLT